MEFYKNLLFVIILIFKMTFTQQFVNKFIILVDIKNVYTFRIKKIIN